MAYMVQWIAPVVRFESTRTNKQPAGSKSAAVESKREQLTPLSRRTFRRRPVVRHKYRNQVASSCIARDDVRKQHHIQLLSRDVIKHIAAGEVIDSLCAVVRELVENAIDAHAKSIVVDISPGPRTVAVYDDGDGVTIQSGMLSMASCHTTSKIDCVEDLASLRSLGFRGQGLWAVAANSKSLTVSSRPSNQDVGTIVTFGPDGSANKGAVHHTAMAVGTVILASDLARLGFSTVDMRECKAWVTSAALCHRDVVFTVRCNGKALWSSSNWFGKDIRHAFATSIGGLFSADDFRAASLHDTVSGTDVNVAVGLPTRVHFPTSNRIIVAVNGRCVDLPNISNVIRDLFKSQLPPRRFPAVFVHISIAKPGVCEWNLHPMKKFMRLGNRANPLDSASLVQQALFSALRFDGPSKIYNSSQISSSVSPRKSLMNLMARTAMASPMRHNCDSNMPIRGIGFKVIGQALNTYIVMEFNKGLYLIEQHTAHERVVYEGLKKQWQSSFVPIKNEVFLPDVVAASDERLFILSSIGFDVSVDDSVCPRRACVKSLPECLLNLSKSEELVETLQALSDLVDNPNCLVDEAAALVACRSAVKNGMVLNMKEMSIIADALMQCQSPHTCPHGRPTFIELSQGDLSAVFQRSWLSGTKPHQSPKTRTGIPRQGILQEITGCSD